jgi:hypothetical protein
MRYTALIVGLLNHIVKEARKAECRCERCYEVSRTCRRAAKLLKGLL